MWTQHTKLGFINGQKPGLRFTPDPGDQGVYKPPENLGDSGIGRPGYIIRLFQNVFNQTHNDQVGYVCIYNII